MNDINETYELKFLEEISQEQIEKEKIEYLDTLKRIRKHRNSQPIIHLPYIRIESPKNAYIYPTDEIVHPIYTESDGYTKIHVWIKDGIYNAGVEIENRYVVLEDEMRPKIKVYDEIPNRIFDIIIKGIVDEKNKV